MSLYIRENGVTKFCEGMFAMTAAENLAKKFPRKYRFVYRDMDVSILEVTA